MEEQRLTRVDTDWRELVEQLKKRLETLRPRLVDLEAELAEQLAAINAFEFELRTKVGHLTHKLDELETEVKKLQDKLRWLGDDWLNSEMYEFGDWSMGERASADGDYRYRNQKTATVEQQALDGEETAVIKTLYRQLARRFHPDMGIDANDRVYRTQMMMAINAAYAAGDVEKLQELMDKPDAAQRIDFAQNDQLLAEALRRELNRLHDRRREINKELARLAEHPSSKMLRGAKILAGEGKDYFARLMKQLHEKIARRQVERDILQTQIEQMDAELSDFSSDEFAEAVWDATLDYGYDLDVEQDFHRFTNKRKI